MHLSVNRLSLMRVIVDVWDNLSAETFTYNTCPSTLQFCLKREMWL